MTETFIIAEAGVNHNGDPRLASELLEAAAEAGASAIKFQTFNAKKLVTQSAEMAEYQKNNTGKTQSQLEMLEKLELTTQDHVALAAKANELGLEFMSTAFDSDSLLFLTTEIGVSRLKIASGELTNAPFLLQHAQTGLDVVVSTGMANLGEIETALAILAFGWLHADTMPDSLESIWRAYMTPRGQELLAEKVTILHCTTQYPTPVDEVNLLAMDTIRSAFGLPTGYSDHTLGTTVPVAAVARGAEMIEKHFTLDRDMEGPDHSASLEPHELKSMIEGIRTVEKALGHSTKGPSESEIPNIPIARKSLVATTDIAVGETFGEQNIGAKRPGTGRSPMDFWQLQGKPAARAYSAGDLIED